MEAGLVAAFRRREDPAMVKIFFLVVLRGVRTRAHELRFLRYIITFPENEN
jgi:hypothetical protein